MVARRVSGPRHRLWRFHRECGYSNLYPPDSATGCGRAYKAATHRAAWEQCAHRPSNRRCDNLFHPATAPRAAPTLEDRYGLQGRRHEETSHRNPQHTAQMLARCGPDSISTIAHCASLKAPCRDCGRRTNKANAAEHKAISHSVARVLDRPPVCDVPTEVEEVSRRIRMTFAERTPGASCRRRTRCHALQHQCTVYILCAVAVARRPCR
jgi:hypothetical protein